MARGQGVSTLTDEFVTKEVVIRGTTYRLKELSETEYDACSKMATGADGRLDSVLLLKVMLSKALVEPKLSAEQLAAKPYRVGNELRAEINRLHWGDDEFEVEEDEDGGKDESSDSSS